MKFLSLYKLIAMVTFDLTNLEHSQVKYKVSRFPDGQQNLTFVDWDTSLGDAAIGWGTNLADHPVKILSRFNSFKDLELIIAAKQLLNHLHVKEVHLYTPYLLGARSDRAFSDTENSYLVEVIAPVLNLQEFESITVIDVHSDVAQACIKNLIVEDNLKLVRFALTDLYIHQHPTTQIPAEALLDRYRLVSPDGGSLKKIYKIADKIGYTEDVLCCSKSRDTEGKLSKIRVPSTTPEELSKDMIIIDDICDGGRTFTNIATQIHERRIGPNGPAKPGKTHLVVTHGIFSNHIAPLFTGHIDGVYTTNSVKDNSTFDWGKDTDMKQVLLYCKQLNVF